MKPLKTGSLCATTPGHNTTFRMDLYDNVNSNFSHDGAVLDPLYFTLPPTEAQQIRGHIQ